MNCQQVETVLTDYLEQNLGPQAQKDARRHVASCLRCSSLLKEVEKLRQELSQFPEVAVRESLIDRILVSTSGKPRSSSLWKDLVLPTLSPFLSRRYAFATLIMFVFLSLMANVLSPEFSALSANKLRPSSIAEQADQWSSKIYEQWFKFNNFKARFWEELKLLKEDASSRLDYHLITLLFRSYDETLQGRQQKAPPDSPGTLPEGESSEEEERR